MASSSNTKRRGRRATGTERIANKLNRRVSFSKRKKGILRKAFQLSVLTGAEIGVIIFSEHGKVYTYGHPSIESVIDKFTSENPIPSSVEDQRNQTPLSENVGMTITNLNNLKNMIELEKSRGEALDKMLADRQIQPISAKINGQSLLYPQEKLQNLSGMIERELNARNRNPQNRNPQVNQSHSFMLNSSQLGFHGGVLPPHHGLSLFGANVNGGSSHAGSSALEGGSSSHNIGPSSFNTGGGWRNGEGMGFAHAGEPYTVGSRNIGVPFAIGQCPINNYSGGLQSDLQLGLHGNGLHYNVPQISAGGSGMNNFVPSLYSSYPPSNAGSSPLATFGGGLQNFGLTMYPNYPPLSAGSSTVATSSGGSQNFGPSSYTGYSPFYAGSSTLTTSGGFLQNNAQVSLFGHGGKYNFEPNALISGGTGGSPSIGYLPFDVGSGFLTTGGLWENGVQESLFDHVGQYIEPNSLTGGGTGGSSFNFVEHGLVGGDQGVQQGIRVNLGSVPQIVGATSLTTQGGAAPTIAGGNTSQGSHGDKDKLLG